MNKVEKVSIGGVAFTLDMDAYIAVNKYLSELADYYSKKDSGSEIMEAIEGRFSELLFERCGVNKVASESDIEEIIKTLGRPSEIENEEAVHSGSEQQTASEPKPKKRLYRDIDNKSIGGVCSGLANYFGIDVTLIRILFAACALVGLFSEHSIILTAVILAYFILWIAMPAAKTVQQNPFFRVGGSRYPGETKFIGYRVQYIVKTLNNNVIAIIIYL